MDNSALEIVCAIKRLLVIAGGVLLFVPVFYGQTFNKRFEFPVDGTGNAGRSVEEVNGDLLIDQAGIDTSGLQRFGILKLNLLGDYLGVLNFGMPGQFQYASHSNASTITPSGNLITAFQDDSVGENAPRHSKIVSVTPDLMIDQEYVVDRTEFEGGFEEVLLNSDGSYIVIGSVQDSLSIPYYGIEIRKLDEELAVEWVEFIGPEQEFTQWRDYLGFEIEPASDGGYFVAGVKRYYDEFNECSSFSYNRNPLLIKLDSQGQEEWRHEFEDCYYQTHPSLSALSSGFVIIGTAEINESISTPSQNWKKHRLIKFTNEGDIVWDKTYGDETISSQPMKTLELNDGSLLTLAWQYGPSPGQYNSVIFKTTSNGDSLWHRWYRFAPETPCLLMDFIETSDDGIVAVGWTFESEGYSSQDTWVLKLNSNGCLTEDCSEYNSISEFDRNIDQLKVFPNPTEKNVTVILPNSEYDLVEVRNMYGKVLIQLSVVHRKSLEIEMSSWSSGMYFVRAINSNSTLTHAVIKK